MTDAEYNSVVEKVRQWVDTFDDPDEPLFGGGDGPRTPRRMLEEIEQRTPWATAFVEKWASDAGIENILNAPLR